MNTSSASNEQIFQYLKEFREEFLGFKKDASNRFDRIDNRLHQVDNRLDQVDNRLDQIDNRLDQVDKRFDQVDNRFDRLEDKVDRLDVKMDRLDDNQCEEKKRIDQVYAAREKVKITFGWQWGMVSFFIALGASVITKIIS